MKTLLDRMKTEYREKLEEKVQEYPLLYTPTKEALSKETNAYSLQLIEYCNLERLLPVDFKTYYTPSVLSEIFDE